MAGVKISALPSIVTPLATDIFPVVQGGVTYKETITQLGTLLLLLSGGTMTGPLILNGDPSSALQAATKQYVDNVATGLNIQASCRVATTASLTATYSNGVSGVGATLTNAGAMAALSIDGISLSVNDRVLVKDQASTFQNGIYTVTTVGSGAVNWVMTRATDFDTAAEIQPGDFVLVLAGTANAQTQWVQTATVVTIGTDAIVWNQFGADINAIITAIQNNTYVYCEDTGAADAYVATPTPAITSYVEGLLIILDPDNANTSATPTLNVSGLGVKTITNNLGGALVAGDIVASQRIYLLYDGTNFRLLNRNYEKRIQNDSFNYILDTGAADAYVATLVPAATAYVAGQRISLKIANTNTVGNPTLNVNALGTKTIVNVDGRTIAVGQILAGMVADFRYDGTNFQLLNPSPKAATVQLITSTGAFSYTPPAGVLYTDFELQGAGGGSGGAGGAGGQGSVGGGGGGGGYMKVRVSGAANLAAITGSVGAGGTAGAAAAGNGGAGGDTTLVVNGGSTWTATGGSLGTGQAASASAQTNGGATGGGTTSGTNGTLLLSSPGGPAGYGTIAASAALGLGAVSSPGGASFLGRSVQAGYVAALAGQLYGGGASGITNGTGVNIAGAVGANGIVIATEYYA